MEISILFIMEIIGTIAFACSGAILGIQKKLDLLGVIVVGVTTAVGGGLIRDILLGVHPAAMFAKPVYAGFAVASVLAVFLVTRFFVKDINTFRQESVDIILRVSDAIGLGAFTVVGVNAGLIHYGGEFGFFSIFLGVLTGVGGGVLRDIFLQEIPAVLKKHIYACASLAGAICYKAIYLRVDAGLSLIISVALVVIIRLLAAHYHWNLPKAIQ